MKRVFLSRVLGMARAAFGAWIFLLSALTLLHTLDKPPFAGVPVWLVPAIAAVEAAAAAAFALRPSGLALAGLYAAFSAAAVLHIMLGQAPWQLLLYALVAAALYLSGQKRL